MTLIGESQITYQIISAAMRVHNCLGMGFLEAFYSEALWLELKQENQSVQTELKLPIIYNGVVLKKYYRCDILINDDIIVELKATPNLYDRDQKQLINYLKATHKEVGLLINFGATSLQFKRCINTKSV